ncbi:aspartyl-tRNA synthetase [Candidatus Desulforudis audaxviator MP104C]|uniref:Aspartate--tRNA(Asp/Asn) ligase n=2 Tax=Candidatus Desulforudis TaxID=471826 RepID=B1I364_DESAP|nr:aspartyl-tRNA synthetase [Candidatus Desulforudis audaxviator MP104C]AZK59401.1 Aspartyl-tRNA synthetase [Candidatus Desulforudis audaxviator]
METDTMRGLKRTHSCGSLSRKEVGLRVVVMGWVDSRRDHGGLVFVDLRDRSGVVQVVFSPEDRKSFTKAQTLRSEYVLAVAGTVRRRPAGTENPKLSTGEIEIQAEEARILNRARTPVFYIEDGVEVDENLRLRYRYLDLRRPEMQRTLEFRHRAAKAVRDFLDSRGFWEIETPFLTRSTPEGARDYLVPSRLNPGKFYALPQSPQLFKQLLMVSGCERYFQIVRCFRDEDLRADRQPEFTQIDLEMSFVDSGDVMALVEEMVAALYRETTGVELEIPFPRITYADAMDRFGTDKPDLRYGMELHDVTDVAAGCGFKVFQTVAGGGGRVKGISVPGGAVFSRKELDDLTRFAGQYGARGLAYLLYTEEGIRSPIAKFFTAGELEALVRRLEAVPGDLLLFVADRPAVVAAALSALRRHLAERLGLIDRSRNEFVWVREFPLLEYDEDEKRFVAVHHPFTAPVEEDIALLTVEPARVRARAYDLVLNGVEIGGGSIRIHRRDVQELVFSAIGLEPGEVKEKFGFLLEAFEYGTPPHGGFAVGFDRLVMLAAGKQTIRDVMAFPKTQSGTDLMTGAPDAVAPAQLRELGIIVASKPKGAAGDG